MNEVVQVKTVAVGGPNGPAHAMMMAVNITDIAADDDFVSTVMEQFRLNRMLAPPDTTLLMISIIGSMTASGFAERWKQLLQTDDISRVFLSTMIVADVIQGTPEGHKLSQSSLV